MYAKAISYPISRDEAVQSARRCVIIRRKRSLVRFNRRKIYSRSLRLDVITPESVPSCWKTA
jgi:hypothetical protein